MRKRIKKFEILDDSYLPGLQVDIVVFAPIALEEDQVGMLRKAVLLTSLPPLPRFSFRNPRKTIPILLHLEL
jgi:hypothetical protein